MRTQRLWVLAVTLAASTSGGCTLISNLDRFKQADAGGANAKDAGSADASAADGGGSANADAGSDAGGANLGCENPETLCVHLKGFTPHVDELVDVDLVTADHTLRARAVLDPLGAADGDVVMPLAIPAAEVPKAGKSSTLHLEIWGDKSGDRMYTAAKDHDWVEPLPADAKDTFMHNSAFTDLLPRPRSIGGDFVMMLSGMAIHKGKQFEVMVIESESGRTVGLYRLHAIPASGEFTVTIPEIIDTGGVAYRIEYYADANGNGTYDGVGPDHSWVTDVESDATGLQLTRPHSGPKIEFAPLSYQFTFK